MANKTSLKPAVVRAYAVEKGLPGVGSRGRIDSEVYFQFLKENPKTAKAVAAEVGFALPSRGNAHLEALTTLAETLV